MTETSYDRDLYAWTHDQAAHLRAKQWEALDLGHPAEEIEALGSEQAHAVESHLANLLLHLLKLAYQRPRRASWIRSINNARRQIELPLRRNPSLRPELPTFLTWAYPRARKDAAREMPLPLATFPDACPWTLEQLQDEDFFPAEDKP